MLDAARAQGHEVIVAAIKEETAPEIERHGAAAVHWMSLGELSKLIETFQRGADIHRATASKMFNVAEDELTHDQRRAAKTINFGVLYGMSAFRLSNELNIPTGQAKDFIDAYFGRYPKIQEYLDRTLEEARMELLHVPKPPAPVLFIHLAASRIPTGWQPYLGAVAAA